MTPEHSQRVKQLLQSALERKPNEQSAFLAEACTGDESLRKDVERGSVLRCEMLDMSNRQGNVEIYVLPIGSF